MKNLYIVTSYTGTGPGRLIKFRQAINFLNDHPGDQYSHVSVSLDEKLDNMLSLARKKRNPFNAGFVQEDIRAGMFKKYKKSKIAVMKLPLDDQTHKNINEGTNYYWENRDDYKFNFLGVFKISFHGKGLRRDKKFFCSEFAATLLAENNVHIIRDLEGRRILPENTKPYDFYTALQNQVIYEGPASGYDGFLEKKEETSRVEIIPIKKKLVYSGQVFSAINHEKTR